VKEKDLLNVVTAMLDRFDWKWWHVPAPMVYANGEWRPFRKGAGVPDIIAIHDDPPRLIFMELKGDEPKGDLTEKQTEFLQAAQHVAKYAMIGQGVTSPAGDHAIGVFAVWPDDIDRVEQMLRSRVVA
jgi:hypothetical protein